MFWRGWGPLVIGPLGHSGRGRAGFGRCGYRPNGEPCGASGKEAANNSGGGRAARQQWPEGAASAGGRSRSGKLRALLLSLCLRSHLRTPAARRRRARGGGGGGDRRRLGFRVSGSSGSRAIELSYCLILKRFLQLVYITTM